MDDIECGGFIFTSNFDSGNLAHVELVLPKVDLPGSRPDKHEPPDYEFNIWTRPDCMGSEFENANRTWFYFGIRVTSKEIALRKSRPCKKGSFKYSAASTLVPISEPSALIKFNLVNMNKQAKLYAQGMAPVFRILPGRPAWERIRDRPAYMHYNGNFAISFKYRMVDDSESTTYFSFTYPYTYEELQQTLQSIDDRLGIMSPYCYRNSSKHVDQEKEIQCDIDKKKPLLVKLNNTFKSKRRSFVARKSTDSSLKSRSVIEKISLPDVCVQEVFKNCTNMDQESEHLLNKMSLEQTISHISEPNKAQKKNKNLSASILSKSNYSTNLKTLLPPAFSTTTVDTAENTLSSSDFSVDCSSHSSPQTNVENNAVLETVSSPQILLEQKILPKSKLNKDTISGKHRSGELSAEMAVHVARHPDDIYYCRELLIKSLQERRVDLLTITSYRNISLDREERLEHLFPDTSVPRPHKFTNKKVIFLSARVHPGETPSSFVLNGFLHSILDRTDPVAATLRRLYVFKIIPFLNPDGVVLGHYRTDSRGCNLNRVYNAPDRHLHPSVFAARALIRYYHNDYQYSFESPSPSLTKCESSPIEKQSISSLLQDSGVSSQLGESAPMSLFELGKLRETTNLLNTDPCSPLRKLQDTLRASIDLMSRRVDVSDRTLNISSVDEDSGVELSRIADDVASRNLLWCDVCLAGVISTTPPPGTKVTNLTTPSATSNTATPAANLSSGLSAISGNDKTCRNCRVRQIGAPFADSVTASSTGSSGGDCTPSAAVTPTMNMPYSAAPPSQDTDYEQETEAPPYDAEKSGLFLYVDMHGHASKRGIFMYGNHIRSASSAQASVCPAGGGGGGGVPQAEPNVIVHELPKVMAVNSLHFHYMACNFSERNMYVKDRRDGTSREGCGRVAVWKLTGLLRSYTLECNYNTGRMVNILPPAKHNADKHLRGGGVPPKYGPKIFEEVGRALGPSILDLTDSNPKTRLCNSDYRSMKGIRESLYKDLMLSGSAKVSRATASGSTSGNVRARTSKTLSLHRADKKSGKAAARKEANARNKLGSRMSAAGTTGKHGGKLQAATSAAATGGSVNPPAGKHAAGLYGAYSQPSCSYEDAADNSAPSDKTSRIAKRRIGGLNKNRRSNKTGNAGLGQGKMRLKSGSKMRGGVRVMPPQRLSECSITATAASSSTSSSAGVRTSSPHSNHSSSDEAAAALRKMSVSSSVVSGTTICADRSAPELPEGGARILKSRVRLQGGIVKRTGSFGDAAAAVCLKKSKNSLRRIRENRLKQRREDLLAATASSSATSNNGAGKPGCSATGVKLVTSAIVRNRGSSRRCLRVSASDKRKKRKRN